MIQPLTTADPGIVEFGVGFDTARFAHHVTFLDTQCQEACKPQYIAESYDGYEQLNTLFKRLARKHPAVHFHVRIDAAGTYAANLQRYLESLPWPMTVSLGQPMQNKRYREVHFPKRKADAAESHAMARFAIVERPKAARPFDPKCDQLRRLGSRYEAASKDVTREINRLHGDLAEVFPEFGAYASDLGSEWVLALLTKYPTPTRIARAHLQSLHAIAHLTPEKAEAIQKAARQSVGCLQSEVAEELVRNQVQVIRQAKARKQTLHQMVEDAFKGLPTSNATQIVTIEGIGVLTAAVLISKIVDIKRFPTADHLISYFGIFPEENQSGTERDGTVKPTSRGKRMSRRGNDMVRALLWNAAKSAISFNPQVKALYQRKLASGRRGDVALGHCMAKLLRQVLGVWTSGRPYDPNFDMPPSPDADTDRAATIDEAAPAPRTKKAAGRKEHCSEEKAVTAATSHATSPAATHQAPAVSSDAVPTDNPRQRLSKRIDFEAIRRQLTLLEVLRVLDWVDPLKGRSTQRRGPCPIHDTPDATTDCFSVDLRRQRYRCFASTCQAHGDVIDLWATVHRVDLREAAEQLLQTFQLTNA